MKDESGQMNKIRAEEEKISENFGKRAQRRLL
jgi:hypothetical protein